MQTACPIYHLCNYCTLQKYTMQYYISSTTVMQKASNSVNVVHAEKCLSA